MKTIKIFAFPSHQEKHRTHGVDFARVIQPMTHLNGYKDENTKFEVTIFDIKKKTDWLYVAKNFDIIFLNYINNPWGFAAMGAMARKHGKLIIMDIDDDIWDLHADNPAHKVFYKGSKALGDFTSICNEVDYITTTSNYLRNVILSKTKKTGDKVMVFPNYVDLKLYSHKPPFKDTDEICLLHFGSTTHFEDLSTSEFLKGVDKIMKRYPQVKVRTVGAFLPKLSKMWGARYENPFGHEDIYTWITDKEKFPKYMSEADILIVPLIEDVYNKCKSQIKWLEVSSAGKPGVWQDIRQYQEVVNDKNGFLAKNHSQWFTAIEKLILDKELRHSMGEQAYEDVQNWTIQGNISKYADFFKKILDKK